ncbi:hypothetical protein B0H14DRAFT_3507034 [Mycena olivaceomarginata]|nr:hypothetical protein B0H14DRAFT_3507034 [Mycena olivaceomarginata]
MLNHGPGWGATPVRRPLLQSFRLVNWVLPSETYCILPSISVPRSLFSTVDDPLIPANPVSADTLQISVAVRDGQFNSELYATSSLRVFMTAILGMVYFVLFASFSVIFMHTFLWFGQDTVLASGRWYALVSVLSMIFLFITVKILPMLCIWAAMLTLFIATIATNKSEGLRLTITYASIVIHAAAAAAA